MKFPPKLALVGALAAVTATAWATHDPMANSSYVPSYAPVAVDPALVAEPVVAQESLGPNETVLVPEPAPAPVVIERSTVAQRPLIIEQRRLSRDERIQLQVMDRIASMPNVTGKIGVEAQDAVVKLSGYTLTAGQAYRAGREAGSVAGVKYVQNEIRARVGGSV